MTDDVGSFDAFVVSCSPRLVRAAWLLVGDRQVAEDLAQETFVRLYPRWRRIRRSDAAGAYAHRTIVRLARRHQRRASSRLEEISADVPDRVDPVPATPDLHDRVRAALLELPQRQREALVLRYFLDFSIDATAKAMGCQPGTVKSQCSKGLATLRADLADRAHIGGDES